MPKAQAPAAVHYRVQAADLNAHLFQVTLTIEAPAVGQALSLPVWIPGSYLVREFSRNLQQLTARQGARAVQLEQAGKNSWLAHCKAGKPLQLQYQVYALDPSVRTAWLDAERGFFNGTSLFLRAHGLEQQPHGLELVATPATAQWSVATGLEARRVTKKGWGSYLAADYDELVDCPVELGCFWSGGFVACGIAHRFVVAGASPAFDAQRLLADTQKICETEIRFWHGKGRGASAKAPQRSYLFMLNAVDEGYGGLEHRNSTALICQRRDLPRLPADSATPAKTEPGVGYGKLMGLISHEYFHTWNVKRLRPADFASYRYDAEQYTQLLWFFEGFTSYYDDLLLRRAGLLDDAGYLTLIARTVNQVAQTPGRKLQSVAQSSMDAWIKYYRPDENTPNATVSYYTKGSLVALCLDLTLRAEGRTQLDAVMRSLWQRCQGGPMSEADLLVTLHHLGGRSFEEEIAAWVHGTAELPLAELLPRFGVRIHLDAAPLEQQLGLRVSESHGIRVKQVLRGGVAEQAGFASGDEWLGLEQDPGRPSARDGGWRLNRLDDIALYAGASRKVRALVSRDQRLLRLPLTLPKGDGETAWRLTVEDARALGRWLDAPPLSGKS